MDTPVPTEVLSRALGKVLAAIEGMGHRAVAVGDMAHQAWGSKREPQSVDLLLSSSEAQREAILGAARGEGLQQAPGGGPLNLRYTDRRTSLTANVDMIEPTTPFLQQIVTRAQKRPILQTLMLLATVDDLILLRAGCAAPGDREKVIELLRGNAGRVDGAYLKKEAEAAGIFDKLKSAWQEAKAQG